MGIGLLQVLIAYGTLDYSNNYALQGLVKTGVVQINPYLAFKRSHIDAKEGTALMLVSRPSLKKNPCR